MAGTPDLGERFEPIRRLGAGGMGEVWLVEDRSSGRCVVAKIGAQGSEESRAWMQREFELGRRLRHPNIVEPESFLDGGPVPFMTMEYLAGGDIRRMVGLPLAEILPVLRQVAEALGHAHDRGIVHRDLKASNILFDENGRPHVADFGIADFADHDLNQPLIGGGSRAAMSPQQLDGLPATPADDLYGFGALMYLLISGTPPLGTKPSVESIRTDEPGALQASWPIPRELQTLVTRLLAKDPDQRPSDMDEVVQSLVRMENQYSDRTSPPKSVTPSSSVKVVPPPRTRTISPVSPAMAERKPGAAEESGSRRIGWWTAGLFGGLGLLLLVVFVFLPRWVEDRPVDPETQAASSSTPMSELQTLPSNHLDPRRVAENLQTSFREKRESAAAIGAETWARPTYTNALEHGISGEESMKEGEYGEAAVSFQEGNRLLASVVSGSDEAMAAALAAGDRALAEGDSSAAAESFGLAARIDSDNDRARQGMARARVLDEVLDLMDRGARAEQSGDLVTAADIYRRVVALDPRFPQARAAFARVESKSEKQLFAAAMSRALQAYDQGDLVNARAAVEQARSLRPGSPEVEEAMRRIEAEQRRRILQSLRARAEAAETSEAWGDAEKLYGQVLELDRNLAFAIQGKDRAEARRKFGDTIEYHLANPQRLVSEAVLAEATSILEKAISTRPRGPILDGQTKRLKELVEISSIPVAVSLHSDNLTQVVIYKVGSFGAFSVIEVKLRPGNYTVVGSRPGYRDVRLEVTVEPGVPAPPVVIRCEEEV